LSAGTDGSSNVGTTGLKVSHADFTVSLVTDKETDPFFFAAM
jgi:hypothetical protein